MSRTPGPTTIELMSERIARPGAGLLLILGLTAAAVPAFAQGGSAAQADPAARVKALLGNSSDFSGAALAPVDLPAPPAAPSSAAKPSAESAVPPGLWATLSAPDAATLAWLTQNLPDLDAASVRVLTPEAADALVSAAVDRGETSLELFTDAGFRGPGVFYIPPAAIAPLFVRYKMHLITPGSGVDLDGKRFAMKAIVAGNNDINILYEHSAGKDAFTFNDTDPDDGHQYTLSTHVSQHIQGPGDLTIEGINVHAYWLQPEIQEIVETSPARGGAPARCLIKTSRKTVAKTVLPIKRR